MVDAHGMIDPFEPAQVRTGVSFGLSSFGYDVRIADEFRILEGRGGAVLDVKALPADLYRDHRGPVCDIPPHGLALGRTVEYFRIPRRVLSLCVGKSTYARCGLVVNVTPLEPEWEGHVTVALCNTASTPVRVYANEGIAQVLFFESDEAPRLSYRDRKGKYQASQGIVDAKV